MEAELKCRMKNICEDIKKAFAELQEMMIHKLEVMAADNENTRTEMEEKVSDMETIKEAVLPHLQVLKSSLVFWDAKTEKDKRSRTREIHEDIKKNFAGCQRVVTLKVEEMSQENMPGTGGSERSLQREAQLLDMDNFKNAVLRHLRSLEHLLDRFHPKAYAEGGGTSGEGTTSKHGESPREKEVSKILEVFSVERLNKAYEQLRPQLKMCLLCFSIFPIDEVIEKRVLIYWWMGEGFATETETKSAEAVGEDYFQSLIDRGFILPVYNKRRGSILRCRMDPFVRWLIINLSRNEGFFNLDETGTPSLEPSKLRRVCLFSKGKRDYSAQILDDQKSTRLHTLFNVNVKFVQLDRGSLPNVKSLVVLQLGRWAAYSGSNDVPENRKKDDLSQYIEIKEAEILDKMGLVSNLRYLSLRGMCGISRLPKWTGPCRHLQILDLRRCHNLNRLPEDIKSLESLTHLDVSECYLLNYMPKSLCELSQLTVLKGFVFGAPPSSSRPCKISELAKLTKLRKLGISISNLEKKSRDLTDLKQIKSLQILVITWSGNELDLALPPDLVKLDLRCFPGELLGKWLQPKYQGKLEKLYIRGGEKLRHLGLEEYGQIKTLRLKYLKSLEMETNEIEELRKHMNYLEIYECPGIRLSYPFDLEGVWVNDDALAPTATSGPCPAPEAAPPANAEPPAAATSSQLSDPPATQQALPASASTSTPPGSTSTSVPTTTPPPATQTPSAPSPPPAARP